MSVTICPLRLLYPSYHDSGVTMCPLCLLYPSYQEGATDPYFTGKLLARMARLALIARQLGEYTIAENLVVRLEVYIYGLKYINIYGLRYIFIMHNYIVCLFSLVFIMRSL